jgi:hypothetical protein
MIERLNRGRDRVRTVIVLICIVALAFKQELLAYVQSHIGQIRLIAEPKPNLFSVPLGDTVPKAVEFGHLEVVIPLIAVIIFFVVAERAADISIDKVRFVRRMLLGRYDVEGRWIDIVYKNRAAVSGGIVDIRYRKGTYSICGYDYKPNGEKGDTFESDSSLYEQGVLRYSFVQHRKNKGGNATYRFSIQGFFGPRYFEGEFYNNGDSSHYEVFGHRIDRSFKEFDYRDTLEHEKMGTLIAKYIAAKKGAFFIEGSAP